MKRSKPMLRLVNMRSLLKLTVFLLFLPSLLAVSRSGLKERKRRDIMNKRRKVKENKKMKNKDVKAKEMI